MTGVAKHYGVAIDPCPPRRPNRKGVVENAIKYITRRWWRNARVGDIAEARQSLDRFCTEIADKRPRHGATVEEAAGTENLLPLPKVPYPAEGSEDRTVERNGLISFRGNFYSVPPDQIGSAVEVRWRLGADAVHVQSQAGRLLATHRLLPRGQGRVVRLPEHARALANVVLANFSSKRPCRRKQNRPPSRAALAIAAGIGAEPAAGNAPIDLGVYQRFIDDQKGRTR